MAKHTQNMEEDLGASSSSNSSPYSDYGGGNSTMHSPDNNNVPTDSSSYFKIRFPVPFLTAEKSTLSATLETHSVDQRCTKDQISLADHCSRLAGAIFTPELSNNNNNRNVWTVSQRVWPTSYKFEPRTDAVDITIISPKELKVHFKVSPNEFRTGLQYLVLELHFQSAAQEHIYGFMLYKFRTRDNSSAEGCVVPDSFLHMLLKEARQMDNVYVDDNEAQKGVKRHCQVDPGPIDPNPIDVNLVAANLVDVSPVIGCYVDNADRMSTESLITLDQLRTRLWFHQDIQRAKTLLKDPGDYYARFSQNEVGCFCIGYLSDAKEIRERRFMPWRRDVFDKGVFIGHDYGWANAGNTSLFFSDITSLIRSMTQEGLLKKAIPAYEI